MFFFGFFCIDNRESSCVSHSLPDLGVYQGIWSGFGLLSVYTYSRKSDKHWLTDFHEHIVNTPLHTRLPLRQSTKAGVSSCMGETSGKKTEKLQREGGWSDASLSRTLLRAVLNVKVVWWWKLPGSSVVGSLKHSSSWTNSCKSQGDLARLTQLSQF